MNRSILILAWLTVQSVFLFAQDTQFTTSGDSDPEAKAVLDKLKAKFEGFTSVEAQFEIILEIPETPRERIVGNIIQSGEKFNVNMDERQVISDGETMWMILHNIEEVQIMDAEDFQEEENFMSPLDLMNIHESGEYIYVLLNEGYENGTLIQQIEFKPIDKDSEYSKIRITVDKKAQSIKRVKVFSKDGSRYTMTVNGWKSNQKYDALTFGFDEDKHFGYEIEDLKW